MTQNINLYERPTARARGLWSREGVTALTAVVVLGAALIAFIDHRGAEAARAETEHATKEAARLELLLAQVPSAASAQSEKLNNEEREVITLETIAARLSSGALGRAGSFTEHLRALGRATVDGVWLTAIKVNHSTATLTLEGKALDASRVPGLIDALGRQPLFAGTQFTAIEVKAEDTDAASKSNSLVRFRITTNSQRRGTRADPPKVDATKRAANGDAARTEQVVARQLDEVLTTTGIEAFAGAVVAYEPVWAIGTGRTATPEQAQAVHAFIRKRIFRDTRILYGGSVKPDNAAAIFAMPDVDGGLIGGASLVAEEFLAIVRAAARAAAGQEASAKG